MTKTASKRPTANERSLEGSIEWIVARHLVPLQDEVLRLRARVEALQEAMRPW